MAINKKESYFRQDGQYIPGELFNPLRIEKSKEAYAKAINEIRLPPEIQPLNDNEKSELLDILISITYDQHPVENFDIVIRRFGERVVPYILNSPIVLDSVAIFKLLDKLVTEKTAGDVLKAMRDRRIEIWSGALAASRGKEKTASGLAGILRDWKFSENFLRSNYLELVKALGETGCDDITDVLADFYKRLSKDKGYNKKARENFKKTGVDWRKDDASEIVKSLAKIGGPKAKAILDKMSKNKK